MKIKIEENQSPDKENLPCDAEGFVKISDIARKFLGGRQTQYISRFIDGLDADYENFGEGLNLKNVFDKEGKGTGSYYDYMLHKDDVNEFVKRVKNYYGEI